MFTVSSLGLAVLFCVITMLGWGSWANTQKLAGKTKWPFELYYWDYAIGVFVFSLLFMFTLGNTGGAGMGAIENLRLAGTNHIAGALLSGVVFNISNILLVVAIDAAGMSVAFPVGVGLALVIGTVTSFLQAPKGVFAVIAGCLISFFYPQLVGTVSPGFNTGDIQPGFLTPYTALFFFATGLLLSNLIVNTVFMKAGGKTYKEYFGGTVKLHSLGVLGGLIWMLALSLNVIASGVAGPAVSYALGQGATLVAAIWGVLIWKEFRAAPAGTAPFIYLMFGGYALGLTLIGMATL